MTLHVALRHRFADFALDLAFAIERPGVTALFGPSGSGKTTTVNAIAGLLRPEAGRIAINGEVVFDSEARRFLPARARRIGYVFQDARLFPHLSVAGNLDYGAKRSPERPSAAERDHLIGLLGISHLLDRRPAGLSGGERQRVALGRALLAKPRLLLLDEPLAALDQHRKGEIIPYLERLRDEAALPIVYVSHSLDEVTRLADEMIVLDRGRAAAQGSVYEIMSRLDLFPLTGRFEAGAVIRATVARHDLEDQLSEVTIGGASLWVPLVPAAVGETVRLRIRARDVMLATEEPSGLSANNVLPGEIVELRADVGAYLDVQVACGEARLLARITHRSRRRLGLEPGQKVFALIKSVSADRTTRVEPQAEEPG